MKWLVPHDRPSWRGVLVNRRAFRLAPACKMLSAPQAARFLLFCGRDQS